MEDEIEPLVLVVCGEEGIEMRVALTTEKLQHASFRPDGLYVSTDELLYGEEVVVPIARVYLVLSAWGEPWGSPDGRGSTDLVTRKGEGPYFAALTLESVMCRMDPDLKDMARSSRAMPLPKGKRENRLIREIVAANRVVGIRAAGKKRRPHLPLILLKLSFL